MYDENENITVEDAEIEDAWAEAEQPSGAAAETAEGAPAGVQRSGSGGERTSAGMNELSRLRGSE